MQKQRGLVPQSQLNTLRLQCGMAHTNLVPQNKEGKEGLQKFPDSPVEPDEVGNRIGSFRTCHNGASVVRGSSDSCVLAYQIIGIIGTCHYAWLMFVLLVETQFHHVGQAGLELLTSSDLPALASQSAGMTTYS
ncbi:hypothetical protein AAY473_012931 [Plecturocebus cupreus]